MLKIIQVTDLHLTPPGVHHIGCDPRERLEAAIASINAEHPDADLVVFTGDLAALGQVAAYEQLQDCLAELKLPYRLCLGNGDHRARFRAAFPTTAVDENGFVQSTEEIDGQHLVFLDTLAADGRHWGELCDARLSWLRARLNDIGEAPVLLFLHHPPFAVGIPLLDSLTLQNAEKLASVLVGKNIRHMFFGHLHRPIAGSWKGIPFSVLRSTVSQFALRLGADSAARSMESPFYAVALISADSVVVHFHDYTYEGPVIEYRPVPAVIVDDETIAYVFQQASTS
ncbi:phosphodiesterase [Bradyrhizobium sp. CCBAU 11386]|uniref:phosphodiesterase n=1 Tax=Bradyrhizobium sp. CCBAU 11386 TaxID=1630837 RepID=UPI0023023E4D|nr:phosphodiesterase [Bradyrhizobium sp. CCBAU 11386]